MTASAGTEFGMPSRARALASAPRLKAASRIHRRRRLSATIARDMAEFFRSSVLWVADFRWDGRERRWFKTFAANADPMPAVVAGLRELYGPRARLVALRPATAAEERDYLRGELPVNAYCPTAR
jgi:hypothetical protein